MSTKPVNIDDYRILAQRRLPKIIFDYLEGGTDDETGLKHNHEVFERYRLMPRRLVDVSKRDIGIELWATSGMTARGMSASPPIATELWHRSEMTRSAISGCEQSQQDSPLFDHLVGASRARLQEAAF